MQYRLIEESPRLADIFRALAGAEHTFIKFLSANDLGLTGSHQAGIYLSKDSWPLFFEKPGPPGENLDAGIVIHWGSGERTDSRVVWYGSKSEYRLTRARQFFRDREASFLGSLLVLSRKEGRYHAWVLGGEEEMEAVLGFFGVDAADTNRLVRFDLEEKVRRRIEAATAQSGGSSLGAAPGEFPSSEKIARLAQRIYQEIYRRELSVDEAIVELIRIDYSLFRWLEEKNYAHLLGRRIDSLEQLLVVSLEIHNRRKSRAGLALEHHLRAVLDLENIDYTFGKTTEGDKRPDFLFPGGESYRDPLFPADRLFFLGAKTTCKDRWRQVLSEADRISTKHLFTLQQGISSAQLAEMRDGGVKLVVPEAFHSHFHPDDRAGLLTLRRFLDTVIAANGRTLSLF